jgi:hypothetical protein
MSAMNPPRPRPRRRKVAAAYAAIRALDAHAASRAQLAADGVRASHIATLYPQDFSDSLPQLRAQLARVSESRLRAQRAACEMITADLLQRSSGLISAIVESKEKVDAQAREELRDYVLIRMNASTEVLPHMKDALNAEIIADAAWLAWWADQHAHALPRLHQPSLDLLAVTVYDTYGLRRRRKLPSAGH